MAGLESTIQQSQVTESLSHLNETISHLVEALNSLERRLSPVLREEEESVGPGKVVESNKVLLSTEIDSATRDISDAYRKVDSVLDRLEL